MTGRDGVEGAAQGEVEPAGVGNAWVTAGTKLGGTV